MINSLMIKLMMMSSSLGILDSSAPDGTTTSFGSILILLLRELFAWIDKLIIWALNATYNLLMLIADTNIFGEQVVQMFATRIYALVAIFMLFKVGLALMKYLVDPESFSDEKTGFNKLITKIILALVLLVMVPYIFAIAFNIQSFVIKNRTLERIVFGTTDTIGSDQSKTLSFTLFSAFFYPDSRVVGPDCNNVYFNNRVSDECIKAISLDDLGEGQGAEHEYVGSVFNYAVQNQDSEVLLSSVLLGAKTTDNQFIFKYNFLLSTIVGAIAFLILFGFCFDIAIRSVKLGFLQLIAPIPILSSIDPKSEVLKKWYEACIKTYVDLFVRLLAIFFAVFVITVVKSNMGLTRHSDGSLIEGEMMLMVLIVLGALLFAKQLPQLISDISGVKLDGGGFTLNPMNRIRQTPIAGAIFSGTTGLAGGIAGGFIAGAESGTRWKGMRHGAFIGAQSGLRATSWGGDKEGGKDPHSFTKGMQETYKNYTGNEMAILRSETIMSNIFGTSGADKRMAEPKKVIKEMENIKFHLGNQMDVKKDERKDLYKRKNEYTDEQFKVEDTRIVNDMMKIQGEMKKAEGIIKVNEDRVKDIKKAYDYDVSNKKSYGDSLKDAQKLKEKVTSEYSFDLSDLDTSGTDEGGTPPTSAPPSAGSTPPSSTTSAPPTNNTTSGTNNDASGRGTYF